MKVSDFMSTSVISLDQDEEVRKAIRIIFNLGLSGVPVVKNRKLIGIITEEDILQKLFPSISEFMEDPLHAQNYEEMEHNLTGLLTKPVKSIMSSRVHSITAKAPLMKAQSMMILNKFSRLPIVNEKNELVGIISQGDIFRALVGTEVPFDDSQEFHSWASPFYESLMSLDTSVGSEVSSLHDLFQKNKANRVLDMFAGTGNHDIALAEKKYEVLGLNRFSLFHKSSIIKYKTVPDHVKKNVNFINTKGDYAHALRGDSRMFDAALFLANELSHHPNDYQSMISAAAGKLRHQNALIILQISNYHKILTKDKGLQNFIEVKSKMAKSVQYAFIEFFDPPDKRNSKIIFNLAIFINKWGRWKQHGINSTELLHLTKDKVRSTLDKIGFKKIDLYGSRFQEPLFEEKFNIEEHDWLNVVATR